MSFKPNPNPNPNPKCSELEKCLTGIVHVFHKYAKKDGDATKLNKQELKCLIQNELPNFLKDCKDQKTIDELMKGLDENQDQQLDFDEYIVATAALAVKIYLDTSAGKSQPCKK
uniref:EF-hand domain-containing protein n=1 Tax=Monopterus albus TaxID=43700 RepID=A0A3Q3J4V6_MONAL|nr:protein S100-A1-like [Monopterus albus]